jgi:predicted ATPase
MFEEAFRTVNESGERWAEPEIHRLFGDFLNRSGPSASSIDSYEQAIAIARAQGSRSFELRATTGLARILSDQGRHAEARDRLLSVCRYFETGFDTPDLADAKALLNELPSIS